MAYSYTPGFDILAGQFLATGIGVKSQLMNKTDIVSALESNRVQIALINWGILDDRKIWEEHFGEDNVIDLYTIPISYRSLPGLNIAFTPDGWPLASR
jgi:hypothetical protein